MLSLRSMVLPGTDMTHPADPCALLSSLSVRKAPGLHDFHLMLA